MRITPSGNGIARPEDRLQELERRLAERMAEVERRLAEAVSPEKMRDNPYRGKPLRLEQNPFEGSWSTAYRLVRQAGHRLPWMDQQHEILQRLRTLDESIQQHRAWLQARLETLTAEGCTAEDKAAVLRVHDRFIAQLTEQVTDLRSKISDFNLKVPLPQLQIRNVRPETYVNDLNAATASLLAALHALPERPSPSPGTGVDPDGRRLTLVYVLVILALFMIAAVALGVATGG